MSKTLALAALLLLSSLTFPHGANGDDQQSSTATPEAAQTEVPAATPATASDKTPTAAQTQRFTGRAGFFERIPPRPPETPEQLQERTSKLREAYSKPTSEWPAPTVDDGVMWKELGLLPQVLHPEENPFSKEKALLGRTLFFDPRLSRTQEMACASCHDPDLGWTDGKTVSFGLSRSELKRNSPPLMNLAHFESFFWDGRAKSLEDQAEQVLANPLEMDCSEDSIQERLGAMPGYQESFRKAFGDPEITIERVAQAIACFERTLVGGRSRFDTFLKGKPEALTDAEIRGLDVFRTTGRCMNCHNGPLLSDNQFHDIGLSYYGRKYEDRGRYEITSNAEDVGRFRTPTLRNIANTRPYMHNGLFELPNVLRMYNAGMPTLVPKEDQQDDALFPKKSPLLKPLGLNSQDLEDLEAFLEALSEPRIRVRPPELPQVSAVEAATEKLPVK